MMESLHDALFRQFAALSRRGAGFWFAVLLVSFLGLYLGFLSRDYDGNGILEAKALEMDFLFAQNHLLYRPLGWLAYELAATFGYDGKSLMVLQILSALCGALTVALVFVSAYRLTNKTIPSVMAAAWFGVTWSQWFFSTDAAYVPLAAMFLAAALCVFFSSGGSHFRHFITGVLVSGAMLAWQASVFLVPVFLLAILIRQRSPSSSSQRLRKAAALAGGAIVPVTATYIAVAVFLYHLRTPSEILGWFFNYQGTRLPLWGRLEADRVYTAARSAAESLLPLWTRIEPWEHITLFYVAALLVAAAFALALAAYARVRGSRWILLGYLAFLPFIVWWDPFEPKWFLVPNVFLAVLIGTVWASAETTRMRAGAAIMLALTGILNFKTTIWPRNRVPGYAMRIAECVGGHMSDTDLFIATDWTWNDQLGYFYNKEQVSMLGERGRHADVEGLIEALRQKAQASQLVGGQVYTVDFESYPEYHRQWLKEQIGVSGADLQIAWDSEYAFQCEDVRVQRLDPVQPMDQVPRSQADSLTIPAPTEPAADWTAPAVAGHAVSAFAEIDTVPGLLRSFMLLESEDRVAGLSQAFISPIGPFSRGVIFNVVEGRYPTGLAIVNPNNRTVQIAITQFDDKGNSVTRSRMAIAARTQVSKYVTQSPLGLANRSGIITFEADAPVVAVALADATQGQTHGFEHLPVQAADRTSNDKLLLVPAENGIRPEIVLANAASERASGILRVRDGATSQEMKYDVAPRGLQLVPWPESADEQLTSLQAIPATGVAPEMLARFTFNADSQARRAVIPATEWRPTYELFAESARDQFRPKEFVSTEILMTNVAELPVEIEVDLEALNGEVQSKTLTLNPSSQLRIPVTDLMPAEASKKGFRGLVRLTPSKAGVFISAMRVQRGSGGRAVVTPQASATETSGPRAYLPSIVGGGGYSSRFVLFPMDAAAAQPLKLRLFDPNGKAVSLTFIRLSN